MYSANTIRRAEQILGYGISSVDGDRAYPVIDGVAYVDLFEGEADDLNIEGATVGFNGKRNGLEYYNEVYISGKCPSEITINVMWGSSCFMTEIDGLLKWLSENSATDSLNEAGVKSKKIEDFSVSKGTASEQQDDVNIILHEGYGFYIRRPFIIDVAREQRDAGRYF